MDPFSRKLFQNSEARQKLAQMGGIMSSSPQLASTVQRFRNGGDVGGMVQPLPLPLPPQLRIDPAFIQMAERLGATPEQLWASLSPQAREATVFRMLGALGEPGAVPPRTDVLGPDLLEGGNIGAGAGSPDRFPAVPTAPEAGFAMPRGTGRGPASGDDLDRFGADMTAVARGVMEPALSGLEDEFGDMFVPRPSAIQGPPMPPAPPPMPAEAIGLDAGVAPPESLATPESLARAQGIQDSAGGLLSEVLNLPGRIGARFAKPVLDAGGVGASLLSPEAGARAFDLSEDLRGFIAREDLPSEELVQDAEPPTAPESAPESAPGAESLAEPTAAADAAGTDPLVQAADLAMGELRGTFGMGDPDRAPQNRRERMEQELEMIKAVFGDKTKDQSRERAMNLAMIGLAIMAGQSPNALTNIAQGALAGTQAMQRAQAAAGEREDELKLMAFRNVMDEDKEERGFQRQLELEEFKAGLRGSEAQSPFNLGTLTTPINRYFDRVAQLETEFGNVENPLWEDVRELPYEERSQMARRIALSETIPAFQGAQDPQILAELRQLEDMASQLGVEGSPEGPRAAGSPPRLTTNAQVEQLKSGQEFIWTDGRRYVKE